MSPAILQAFDAGVAAEHHANNHFDNATYRYIMNAVMHAAGYSNIPFFDWFYVRTFVKHTSVVSFLYRVEQHLRCARSPLNWWCRIAHVRFTSAIVFRSI